MIHSLPLRVSQSKKSQVSGSGSEHPKPHRGGQLHQRPLLRLAPLSIGAVAVACGGELIDELETFLDLVRHRHPEWRILVLTDRELGTRDGVDVEILSAEELADLGDVQARDRGHRWSRPWIGAKLEVLRRAVLRYECGVLLCDSDLVLTDRLPDMSWPADLVLSQHGGPNPDNTVPSYHGIYNAGMVLTDRIEIVERWISLYRQGAGTFYEQQPLEVIAREWVTDVFPSVWNWGGWRWQEDLEESGRRPPVLHCHLQPKYADDPRQPSSNAGLRSVARAAIADFALAKESPDKIAFVHNAKAAGSSFATLMDRKVCRRLGYQNLNSWGLGLRRDWSADELRLLAHGQLWGQVGERWFVHNHSQHWWRQSTELYTKEGWTLVALYRPIRERLASFWSWSQGLREKTGQTPMRGPIAKMQTFDEFLAMMLNDPRYSREWEVPVCAEIESCLWYPATDAGIMEAFTNLFGLELERLTRFNVSQNPGWAGLSDQLDSSLIARVDEDPRVRAWDVLAADRGLEN